MAFLGSRYIFKPIGNNDKQGFQPRITKHLKHGTFGLGADLDSAMGALFDLCVKEDAPIIAHAAYSNGAGIKYASRAEPRFWIDVLKRPNWKNLRLCLAHQGRFKYPETISSSDVPSDQKTWEWAIGRYVKDNPTCNLYMDISYFSEVLTDGAAERSRIGKSLRSWIDVCDPDVKHILFGTDWTMIGKEPNYPKYVSIVQKFLANDCGLKEAQIDQIMGGNAIRYFGLESSDSTRKRLNKFYEYNKIPSARLANF
jgi:hypothetical protein